MTSFFSHSDNNHSFEQQSVELFSNLATREELTRAELTRDALNGLKAILDAAKRAEEVSAYRLCANIGALTAKSASTSGLFTEKRGHKRPREEEQNIFTPKK